MQINFTESTHTYWVERGDLKEKVPSVSTIIGNILELDKAYKNIDPFYANRGTAVHKAIELHIADNLDEESLDDEVIPFFNAYKKFSNLTKFDPLESERKVFSEELWVAGTLDLIGEIQNKRVLIDIKTGQKQKWHQIQTAGYALLANCPDIFRYCLYITKKETFKLEPHTNSIDFDVFKAMATVFNRKGNYK